jgi:hypothetical protein
LLAPSMRPLCEDGKSVISVTASEEPSPTRTTDYGQVSTCVNLGLRKASTAFYGNLSGKPSSNDSRSPHEAAAFVQGDGQMKLVPAALAMLLAGSLPALAHDVPAEVAKSPPAGAFKAVSSLVKLPDFLPGMGQLFVDPASLPAGPFLAYDHDGALVSTIYMLPVKDLNPDKRFEDLAAPGGNVDHVDVYYNAGHPGVEEPHVHLVLWHVAAADEARVAQ